MRCGCGVRCGLWLFFFSSRRRHTRFDCDWSSDVCSSDLETIRENNARLMYWNDRKQGASHEAALANLLRPKVGDAYGTEMSKATVNPTLTEIGRASCRERV